VTTPQALLLSLPCVPVAGALVAGLLPARRGRAIRAVGWTASLAALAVWVWLRAVVEAGPGPWVSLQAPWVPAFGISVHLALDGTGVLMSGLVAAVAVAAAVATLPFEPGLSRVHVVSLLLAEAGMLGLVAAWDLILFVTFWEVTLIPFYFLMGRGPRAGAAAATRFVVTSVTSSVLMWVGLLWAVRLAGGTPTFDLIELSARLAIQPEVPGSLVLLLSVACLVRMAALPLHTWLTVAVADVPTAAAMLLAGGVLPLGGFGLVHVVGRLCGPDLGGVGDWFMWLGLATATGGGLAALVQRDLKRLLAFVCLAQVGLASAGLAMPSEAARAGGLHLLVAAGLGGAALFLFAGVVCQARGSQRLVDLAGLWASHPFFAGMAFAAVASAAAVPGTAGFVGAAQVLQGTGGGWLGVAMLALALLCPGVAVVWAYRRVVGGSYQGDVWSAERWPRKRQAVVLAVLALAILATGLFPALVSPGTGQGSTAVASADTRGQAGEGTP